MGQLEFQYIVCCALGCVGTLLACFVTSAPAGDTFGALSMVAVLFGAVYVAEVEGWI